MSTALKLPEGPFPLPQHQPELDDWMWLLDDDERDREATADEYLDGVQLPVPSIDCAALAERHLYQVRLIRRELDQIAAQAAAMRERVNTWERRRRDRLERREAWHKGGLMAYMVYCGRKTLDMVNGTLRVVTGRERVEVQDLEAFLAAAPEAFVRTVREPDKMALKRHLRATGELLPGTDVVRGDDSLSCTFGEAAP